ncbi:MAG TPA: hypothetical protein DER09_08455 [Prolixibacteraceae bacterium]|nr:hypothetical protein [Prolixibacteraceae bacterium]
MAAISFFVFMIIKFNYTRIYFDKGKPVEPAKCYITFAKSYIILTFRYLKVYQKKAPIIKITTGGF